VANDAQRGDKLAVVVVQDPPPYVVGYEVARAGAVGNAKIICRILRCVGI